MNLRPYRALTLANLRQHLRNPLAVSSVLPESRSRPGPPRPATRG